MAYGRGGAGNILQAKEDTKKAASDIEAAHASTTTQPTAEPTPQQPPSDYAHMGRGGAGNWYQPTALSKDGTFTQPADATTQPTSSQPAVSTPWHPEGQELPVARSGRGGAGNFVWRSEEQVRLEREGREMQDMKRKEDVSEAVERDVERGLQMPGRARLGGEKVGSGGVSGRGW